MRANAAMKISENIALEREDLVKEVELLRSLNARMLDEKDMRPNSLPVDPCYITGLPFPL